MGLTGNIILNLYSVIVLFIVYIQTRKRASMHSLQDRLFFHILWLTAMMLFFDVLGRLDGRPGTIYPLLNSAGNFMLFLLNPILPTIWLLYVHEQLYQRKKGIKRILIPCLVVFSIHTLLLIATQYTGWFYTIDAQNVYRRGPLFLLSGGIVAGLLLTSAIIIFRNRKWMEKSQYRSLLLFAAPPFIATLLHAMIYGVSIVLNGIVLSILIVFLNIQSRSLITDYLTGVYNRKGFDMLLREKIKTSSPGRTFSAILLDFDHFKGINDTFGHDTGDKALQKSVELLRDCIRSTDFIARYGGDEFVILLNTSVKEELEAVVQRINSAIEKFNQDGGHPFTIGFSAGYAVYDADAQHNAEYFLKLLDLMMYQMKQGQAAES